MLAGQVLIEPKLLDRDPFSQIDAGHWVFWLCDDCMQFSPVGSFALSPTIGQRVGCESLGCIRMHLTIHTAENVLIVSTDHIYSGLVHLHFTAFSPQHAMDH